jgi:membrane fusion protein, adhesin transport system
MSKTAPKGKDPGKPGNSINQPSEWAKVRGQWAKDQAARVQAHADHYFGTDDELPLSAHVLLLTIAAFFGLFILWASFATLDELTRGEGRVVPSSEVQKIQSLEGGIIDEFLVHEGDTVTKGQPLIRMRDIQATSDLGVNRKKYLGLKAKITRLKALAEGSGEAPQFDDEVMKGAPESVREEMDSFRATMNNQRSQLDVLQSQLTQKESEVNELNSRVSDLRASLAITAEQRNVIAPLVERGSASKVELLQIQREMKDKQTELNSAQTSLPRAQSAIREVEARINELKSASKADAQTDLAAATAEMNAISESLAALQDRKMRTELKSPAVGVVQSIKITTVGGVVKPGDEVIEVVPSDAPLLVEARVKPSDIAFLHPGQQATVKITAYDYSIYGGLKGEVVDISADSITDEKGQTFYRVRIRTPQTYLIHNGQRLNIIPGMVAHADILTGKRTVMEYLLKPFIKTIDQAMRER